jgi:hypothetical protein
MYVCRYTEEDAVAESRDTKVNNQVLRELLEEIRQDEKRRVAFPFWGNWNNWRNWQNWGNWQNWLNWWT